MLIGMTRKRIQSGKRRGLRSSEVLSKEKLVTVRIARSGNKTNPMAIQNQPNHVFFPMVFPSIKIAFRGVEGDGFNLLTKKQPAENNSTKVAQFHGKTADLTASAFVYFCYLFIHFVLTCVCWSHGCFRDYRCSHMSVHAFKHCEHNASGICLQVYYVCMFHFSYDTNANYHLLLVHQCNNKNLLHFLGLS